MAKSDYVTRDEFIEVIDDLRLELLAMEQRLSAQIQTVVKLIS
jgi:hypothetical protein